MCHCPAVTVSALICYDFFADYKSCHGSVQSLMSLNPREAAHAHKTHIRCGSDLTPKQSSAATTSNGYQRPASV